jgi:N6-adenosine-specific RNA methylase IME4
MSLEELRAMPVSGLAADDCYLLMWTTGPKLAESVGVMEAWGFRYVTVFFTWVKTSSRGRERICPGMYTLPSTEFCLLGMRGRSQHLKRDSHIRQLLVEPMTGHSRKPDESYARLERFFEPGARRIELFARRVMPGWEGWGNEVDHDQKGSSISRLESTS